VSSRNNFDELIDEPVADDQPPEPIAFRPTRTPSSLGATSVSRDLLLDELANQDSWLTVVVNGRTLVFGAAIKLLRQLPDDARLRRRGRWIFVDPNPFAVAPDGPPASDLLVNQLIARQDATDREQSAESGWLRRLAGRLRPGR
jgi:hypothetical protein